MAFSSRTLAVFVCVILASLAFLTQDGLAARILAEASTRKYRLPLLLFASYILAA
jgi:hypothetical protein